MLKHLHHTRSITRSRFPALSNIPYCCFPQKARPYFNSGVANRSSKLATYHCLGRQLPYQQTNMIQTDTQAINLSYYLNHKHKLLSITKHFYLLCSTCVYVIYILLTRTPLNSKAISFDLHVLSILQAFTLSQDQTLSI